MKKLVLVISVFILISAIYAQSVFADELELPFQGKVDASSDVGAFTIKNTGQGTVGNFELTNPGNSAPALQGKTKGSGPAVRARTTGSGTSIESVTTGTGSAGNFIIDNSESKAPAIRASTNGKGLAAIFDGDVSISGTLNLDSLIYENDEQGISIEGDIDSLLSAIKDGKLISVQYLSNDGLVIWRRTCDSLAVKQDIQKVAVCFISMVPDTKNLNLEPPYFLEQHSYDSDGYSRVIKFDLKNGEVVARQDRDLSIKWFVGN
ncbi:hypothetical protein SPB21_01470 [Leptothoe sp. ISB3NOV94-8A]